MRNLGSSYRTTGIRRRVVLLGHPVNGEKETGKGEKKVGVL